MFTWALALVAAAAPAGSVSPQEVWPQWRGPTGDSVVPGGRLPTQWSTTENVEWKTALPGWSASTPAVWQDAIFVTTQDGERLLLLRLDRKSGKVVWQREAGKGTPRRKGALGNGRFHNEHNMATPSPVTDGTHVWAHFGNGDLACYDFAGRKAWSLNLMQSFGPYTIWWGHANSPCLAGDLLISACMQDPKDGGQSYLVAHDKLTGEQRWLVKRNTGATSEPADSYTTPVLRQIGGRTELIVLGGNVLDAYDPKSGARLWHCGVFAGNRVIPGPTIVGDTVYAVQGMRGPLFAVKAGGAGAVKGSDVLWKYTGTTPDAASAVAVNGLVFLATNAGVVVCLDAKTGAELWKERLDDSYRATPLVAGNRVYLFAKDGKTTIIEAARELRVLGRNDLGEEVMAAPAAVGGALLIRTREHVYLIANRTR